MKLGKLRPKLLQNVTFGLKVTRFGLKVTLGWVNPGLNQCIFDDRVLKIECLGWANFAQKRCHFWVKTPLLKMSNPSLQPSYIYYRNLQKNTEKKKKLDNYFHFKIL